MAQCVAVNADGSLSLSASDPCTELVVLTPAEYSTLATNPLNLSAEDGALMSIAIVGVWAVAWSIRALADVLRSGGEPNE